MPVNQIDVKAQLKAFPYVSPPSIVSATGGVSQSALDQIISLLEEGSSQIPTDIADLIGPGATPPSVVGQDEWQISEMADLSWVGKITRPLENSLKAIDKIVTILGKVLRIIELFSSVFLSFSKLIVSAIELAQNKLNEFGMETMGFGVHANVLVPPALMKLVGDIDSRNQLRGGFDGFLTRLESSTKNVRDENRPTYSTNDYVGGLIIVLDTESIDEAWRGLKQLAAMFDFLQLFGLNLTPPPPTNLNGFSGIFSFNEEEEEYEVLDVVSEESDEERKFGIQIEWDQTYTASGFNIYRSRVAGGTTRLVEYKPTSLVDNKETGEPGLLTIVWDRILNRKAKVDTIQLSEREVQVYEDPLFPGPVFVSAGLNSRLKYVDTYIETEVLNPEAPVEEQIHVPIEIDDEGVKWVITNYYYIIRACDEDGNGEGPNSIELSVAVKTCNDAFSIADLIQHPNGRFEFFATGYGKLNNWSSIKLTKMIPWFGEIVDILNDFLDTLKGMATNASDSFSDFLDQIQSKVQMYTDILGIVSDLIESLSDFILGPSIALLNVSPVKGGMPVFLERVKNAQVPEGDSFSGSNGITVGIVLVYGASAGQIARLAIMKRAFDFVYAAFVRKFGKI